MYFQPSLSDARLWPHPPNSKRLLQSLKKCQPAVAEKRALNTGNGGPTGWDCLFPIRFMPERIEMALPLPTTLFLDLSQYAVMLFAPFECFHLPPPPRPSAEAEPISKGHCRKWHHEAESLMTDISTMGHIELIPSPTKAIHVHRVWWYLYMHFLATLSDVTWLNFGGNNSVDLYPCQSSSVKAGTTDQNIMCPSLVSRCMTLWIKLHNKYRYAAGLCPSMIS